MSLRLCTHIKTNGVKCASPALRHHTLCYFHYQWQRRDQRRVRLGGPIGMNKNSGIDLPLLDGPEAILVSLMEIQHALLDQRIPIKMGTALLYSLQLALQARIPTSGLSAREPVRECPELELELDMERAKSLRPAKEKCATCPKQETCLSARNCRKLPKLPAGYRREADRLIRDPVDASTQPCHPAPGAPFKPAVALSGVVPDITTAPSSRAREGSRALSPARETRVEGPAFSPTEAPTPKTPAEPETTTDALRECSPGRESGVTGRKFSPSRAYARRHITNDATSSLATGNRQLATIPNADNILVSKPNALIDLAEKSPKDTENKDPQNEGVVNS